MLLREDAAEALDGHRSGLTLTQVEDHEGRGLPWYQATPDVELPRVVDASNNGYVCDMQCVRCQRDGFFTDRMRLAPLYERTSLDDISPHLNFVGSYERYGVSGPTRLVGARLFARRDTGERLVQVARRSNLVLRSLRVLRE